MTLQITTLLQQPISDRCLVCCSCCSSCSRCSTPSMAAQQRRGADARAWCFWWTTIAIIGTIQGRKEAISRSQKGLPTANATSPFAVSRRFSSAQLGQLLMAQKLRSPLLVMVALAIKATIHFCSLIRYIYPCLHVHISLDARAKQASFTCPQTTNLRAQTFTPPGIDLRLTGRLQSMHCKRDDSLWS